MPHYEYDFKIEAGSEKEATEKLKALATLSAKLSAKELVKLAHTVKYDPIKTAMAKTYLGL